MDEDKEGFSVRVWAIDPDGDLEPLISADESHFRGAVPDVGDTYVMWHLHDFYQFYSIQRRYFIDSVDNDHGWCVIVRKIEPASHMETVVKEWTDETHFWRDISHKEEERKSKATEKEWERITRPRKVKKPSAEVRKKTKNGFAAPHISGNLEPILRYMVNHPLCATPDVIPGAGIKWMEQLTELGALVEVELDPSGHRSWQLTKLGRSCVGSETVVHREPVKTKRPRNRRP